MAEVVNIDGKKYAIGLLWTAIMESDNIRRDAYAELEDLEKDIFIIRKEPTQQIGIGSTKDGLKSGMMSLAAMAADVYVGDNIVVFQLNENIFWGATIEGGAVLEEFIGESKTELVSWFIKNKNTGRFNNFIGPSSLGIRDLNPTPTLEGFIQDGLSICSTKIEKIGDSNRKRIKIIAIALICIISFIAVKKHEENEALKKKISLQQQLLNKAKKSIELKKPLSYTPYKYIAKRCINVLSITRKNIPNWQAKEIKCSADSIEIDYSRNYKGLTSDLFKYLPGFNIKLTNKLTKAKLKYHNIQDRNIEFTSEKIKKLGFKKFFVDDFFRRHGFVLNWKSNVLLLPSYSKLKYGLNSDSFYVAFPVFPDSWVYNIDNIPGVDVKSIEYKDYKWILKGVFYYD